MWLLLKLIIHLLTAIQPQAWHVRILCSHQLRQSPFGKKLVWVGLEYHLSTLAYWLSSGVNPSENQQTWRRRLDQNAKLYWSCCSSFTVEVPLQWILLACTNYEDMCEIFEPSLYTSCLWVQYTQLLAAPRPFCTLSMGNACVLHGQQSYNIRRCHHVSTISVTARCSGFLFRTRQQKDTRYRGQPRRHWSSISPDFSVSLVNLSTMLL